MLVDGGGGSFIYVQFWIESWEDMPDMISLILMPRICCTLWDGDSCDSEQPGSDFKGVIFTFSSGKNEIRQRQRDKTTATR